MSLTSLLSSSASQSNGIKNARPKQPTVLRKISSQANKPPILGQLPQLLADGVSPDELFEKYTISEVRAVQQKLKQDADAKQEELRLMVGERYRDLLQASTSIISMSRSSRRVTEALEETRGMVLGQEDPPSPRRGSSVGHNDAQLHSLQVLAAHVKLLLDAPEHLWRLIEKKDILTAAWLFLLGRVVHRALLRDDDSEEQTWSAQGLDVLEQFPLIHRQWETIAQFRSQIVHKATLSLGDYSLPPTSVCSILLTLHLLDSRPLSDTLSTLLDQRSKTLHNLLSWKRLNAANSPLSPVTPQLANGSSHHASSKASLHDVRQVTLAALEAMSSTAHTSRIVFDVSGSRPPLLRSVLEYLQVDTPSERQKTDLPMELQLTTDSLLKSLPSSIHYQLLPATIQLYRPYIDLNSSSTSVSSSTFENTLGSWYRKSMNALGSSVEEWFSYLSSVKDVWNLRASARKWIDTHSELKEAEKSHVEDLVDDICQRRIVSIWKDELAEADSLFKTSLSSVIKSLYNGSQDLNSEDSDVQTSTLLSLSSTNQLSDASLGKYKASLCRQLLGRTHMLDNVLRTLEGCARSLHNNLCEVLTGDDTQTRSLTDKLHASYRPEAQHICESVLNTLEDASSSCEDSRLGMSSLVFVGRVAEELESSSFSSDLNCDETYVQEFVGKLRRLHDRTTDRWQKHTVTKILSDYKEAVRSPDDTRQSATASFAPSPSLVRSLLALSSSIRQLGTLRSPSSQRMAGAALRSLILDVCSAGIGDGLPSLHDLLLLQRVAELRRWSDVVEIVDQRSTALARQLDKASSLTDLEIAASEYISRTQILFAALLLPEESPQDSAAPRDKLEYLLHYGIPNVGQKFQPTMELATPSPRFGMLLAASVGDR